MTEPVEDVEALRAERDELREALRRTLENLRAAISDILLMQHVVPEEMARHIDQRLPVLRRAAGWLPDDDYPNPLGLLSANPPDDEATISQ